MSPETGARVMEETRGYPEAAHGTEFKILLQSLLIKTLRPKGGKAEKKPESRVKRG